MVRHDAGIGTDGVVRRAADEHVWVARTARPSFRPVAAAVVEHLA